MLRPDGGELALWRASRPSVGVRSARLSSHPVGDQARGRLLVLDDFATHLKKSCSVWWLNAA